MKLKYLDEKHKVDRAFLQSLFLFFSLLISFPGTVHGSHKLCWLRRLEEGFIPEISPGLLSENSTEVQRTLLWIQTTFHQRSRMPIHFTVLIQNSMLPTTILQALTLKISYPKQALRSSMVSQKIFSYLL